MVGGRSEPVHLPDSGKCGLDLLEVLLARGFTFEAAVFHDDLALGRQQERRGHWSTPTSARCPLGSPRTANGGSDFFTNASIGGFCSSRDTAIYHAAGPRIFPWSSVITGNDFLHGAAPGGPEVDEHDLALQVRQRSFETESWRNPGTPRRPWVRSCQGGEAAGQHGQQTGEAGGDAGTGWSVGLGDDVCMESSMGECAPRGQNGRSLSPNCASMSRSPSSGPNRRRR